MAHFNYPIASLMRKCQNIPCYTHKLYSTSVKKGLVLGAYTEKGEETVQLTKEANDFDASIGGKLSQHLNLGSPLKSGGARVFWGLHKDFPAVALVGLGSSKAKFNQEEEIDEARENIRVASAAGCKALKSAGMNSISIDALGGAGPAAEGASLSLYTYQENKLEKERKTPPQIELNSNDKNVKEQWNRGIILGDSQNLARRLMETPANLMTPQIFAQNAVKELKPLGVQVTIRDKKWAEEKKMFSFLSVASGSDEPPVFLEMSYNNAQKKDEKPICLVGKGVTFDCGGVSIKPSANMAAMRGDMGGAACVVSAIRAVAALKLPVNLIGLIPLTENMVNGKATKPGDVVVAMNGKSILVDNTDAEGRLILADALCYAQSFNPLWTVDLATLTGAMRVSLGGCAAGAFTKSSHLWQAALNASAISGDRLWRFPLWKDYVRRVTDYPNVDVHNVGKGKGGGSCTAAAFLSQFAPTTSPWMHLDIASVMDETDDQPYLDKGMTGRPTRTLVELVTKKYINEK